MMDREEILEKLSEIMQEVFDDVPSITEDTTADDIEDWDSIGHVYLIAEIEDEFNIKFGEKMNDVGTVKAIIDFIVEFSGE